MSATPAATMLHDLGLTDEYPLATGPVAVGGVAGRCTARRSPSPNTAGLGSWARWGMLRCRIARATFPG